MTSLITSSAIAILGFACAALAATSSSNDPAPATTRATNASAPVDLPPAVVAVQPLLVGKSPDDVLAILTAQFGAPARDIGSGLSIPEWDIGGGILRYHPGSGPTFAINGKRVRLIPTHNTLGANLIGSYELSTPPDPANHGNQFWLGNLELRPDHRYSYTPAHGGEPAKDDGNFFAHHPDGAYTIEYPKGLKEDALLEGQPDQSTIATLTIKGKDSPATTLEVKVDASHSLHLAAPGGAKLPYTANKGWLQSWN